MLKHLLLISLHLCVLPSCDSARADHHAEVDLQEKVSTSVIQILPTTPVLADSPLRTENFIENEIASLSMGAVLDEAFSDLGLENRGFGIDTIKKKLKVERIEGTDMARITATGKEEITGKLIIDRLIQSYLKIRKESEVEMGWRRLSALDDELIAQADLVQDHRKEFGVLIQQFGIPYFENQPIQPGREEIRSLSKAREKLHELRLKETLLKAELSGLDKGSGESELLARKLKKVSLQARAVQELADERQENAIRLSLKQSNYQQARQSYEGSLTMLREMEKKHQKLRLALKMPTTPLIVREKTE